MLEAASFSERSEREGESAQRCRARLERHRRTAERAVRSSIFLFSHIMATYKNIIMSLLFQAKALAEKNMRDLVAQKEQAERNVSTHPNSFSLRPLNYCFID